jgi:hypothetical protein
MLNSNWTTHKDVTSLGSSLGSWTLSKELLKWKVDKNNSQRNGELVQNIKYVDLYERVMVKVNLVHAQNINN